MSGRVDHINAVTFHGRKGAVRNAFRYSIDYVLLDPEARIEAPSLFTRNGRNLASVHDIDHGGAPKDGKGAAWVRDVFAQHHITGVARLELLAQPRMWGHVFNPVSFWLGYDAQDGLIVVLAEVSNTFGDRHSYLCHHADLRPIEPTDRLASNKIFHVSPFQPVAGGYEFRFDIRDDKIGIWIDYTQADGGLIATLTGTRSALTNGDILRAAWRRPMGSRRVLGLIHWQAVKLWWKSATFRSRPLPPEQEVSR